jgi:hypothetical protein
MNSELLKSNKSAIDFDEVLNGFIEALIWQDEELDGSTIIDISYSAKERSKNVVNTFLSATCFDNDATNEVLEHSFGKTGHDIALQMLGHGVGFWEQNSTKRLHTIMDFLINTKAIIPFRYYLNEDTRKLEWDGI